MNEMEIVRTPAVVGAEIRNLAQAAKYMTVWYAVEIGRRLTEAKELVPHGEWLNWLKTETEFSQPSASRMMKIYAEYGADQKSLFGAETKYSTLNNLSVSNALRLLAVPEEERESFASEVDAEHLSARELEQAIRERDAAIRRAETAEEDAANLERMGREAADQLTDALSALEDKEREAEAADAEIAELKRQVAELENRPVEVAVAEPDPAAVDKAVSDALAAAEAEHKAALDKLKKKLDAAKKAQEKAVQAEKDARAKLETAEKDGKEKLAEAQRAAGGEVEGYKRELERMRKELAMSGEAMVTFRLRFTAWQDAYRSMVEALASVEGEAHGNCRRAMQMVIENWEKEAGEA